MAIHDPTLELLRKLGDRSQWFVVEGVPVFAPHVRKDPEGNEIVVDEARLHRIVDTHYQRLREAGVVPRISPGHMLKDPRTPEAQQPDIFGYAPHWRVGKFGPAQKPAILADYYFFPRYAEEAKKYPYRSAEFYPKSDEITGIALLKRDPQLDLGVLTYERSNGCLCYSMGDAMPDPTQAPTTQPSSPTPAAPAPDEKDKADYARFCGFLKQYMADGGAVPSPTNPAPAKPADATQPADPVGYARLQQQLDGLRQQNEQLALSYSRSEATRIINELASAEGGGYLFKDRTKEIDKLARMTPEQRTERVQEIVEHYQRAPVGGDFLQLEDVTEPANLTATPGGPAADPLKVDRRSGKFDQARFDAALAYMREPGNECDDFDHALAAVGKK